MSRAAHFRKSGCSVLSINRPLSRKAEPEDLGGLEVGELRLPEASRRGWKHFVRLVFTVGVQPHPFLHALDQADLLGAGVFILVAVVIGGPHRHDADCAA